MTEQGMLQKLIRTCKANGATLFRIHEGEDWACEPTSNERQLMDAANSTGEDNLYCYDADGTRLGRFYLVWGNDPSGEELIADYGITPFTEAVDAAMRA